MERIERLRAWARAPVERQVDRLSSYLTTEYTRLQRLTPIAASQHRPHYLFHTWDRVIGPHAWRESGYDSDEMRWSLQFLGHPQRNRSVIEIGANIGTTTIPLVIEYGAARVEAFEPEPGNVKLLRCNLILNDCEERVTVHRAAVSNYTGTLTMELSGHNAGDHRIITGDNTAPRPLWDAAPRQTVSVDSLQLRDFKIPEDLGLVWVDTQGHEACVLEGAPDFGVPWVIEYWPYALRRAGGLEILNRQVSDRFSARVDVRASIETGAPQFVTADGLERLTERLGDDAYTDLILLP